MAQAAKEASRKGSPRGSPRLPPAEAPPTAILTPIHAILTPIHAILTPIHAILTLIHAILTLIHAILTPMHAIPGPCRRGRKQERGEARLRFDFWRDSKSHNRVNDRPIWELLVPEADAEVHLNAAAEDCGGDFNAI